MSIVKSSMNNWLIFALSAPLLWAFTNVFDGALRRNFIKNDFALTWMSAAGRLPAVILLFLIAGINVPDAKSVLFMFIGGALWTLPMFFYYKAIEKEDPSRIALLLQLVPLFTLLIAFFALRERLTEPQIFAFVLLMTGGALAAFSKLKGIWRIGKSFFLMSLACFLWASSDVIFKKFEPAFSGFLNAFAIYFLGSFLVSFIIFAMPKRRSEILVHFFNLPMRAWLMILGTIFAGISGSLSFAYALTLGKASLTSVMMGIQPLFVLLLGLFMAIFIRGIRREDLHKETLILKGVSFFFIIAGLIFLQL